MKNLLVGVIVLLSLITPSYAQSVQTYSEVGVRMYHYLGSGEESSWTGNHIRTTVDVSARKFSLRVSPILRYDSEFYHSTWGELREDEFRHVLEMEELYAKLPFGFGVGKRITQPCILTESPVCPEDGWSPHDFIDPLNGFDEYLGVPSVWWATEGRSLSFEVRYSPYESVSKMPYKGRWFLLGGIDSLLTRHVGKDGKWMSRVEMRGQKSSLGLSLYKGQDYAPTPFVRVEQMPVVLEYLYPYRTSVTAQYSYYGNLINRTSIGYTKTDGVERIEFGTEIEHQILNIYESTVFMIGAIGSVLLDGFKLEASNPQSLRYGWNNSIYGGVEFQTQDFIVRIPTVLVDWKGFLFLPEVQYQYECANGCSSIKFSFGLMSVSGTKSGFLGQFRGNSRIASSITLEF